MKLRLAAVALTAIALLTAVVFLGSCSSLKRVSAAEFVRSARRGQLDTAATARVLALTDERVYLERTNLISSSSKAEVSVLWAPVAELSQAELQELRQLVTEASRGR